MGLARWARSHAAWVRAGRAAANTGASVRAGARAGARAGVKVRAGASSYSYSCSGL